MVEKISGHAGKLLGDSQHVTVQSIDGTPFVVKFDSSSQQGILKGIEDIISKTSAGLFQPGDTLEKVTAKLPIVADHLRGAADEFGLLGSFGTSDIFRRLAAFVEQPDKILPKSQALTFDKALGMMHHNIDQAQDAASRTAALEAAAIFSRGLLTDMFKNMIKEKSQEPAR